MPKAYFTKDAYHPRKRSIYPDYKAGKIYDLNEDEFNYFVIDKKVAFVPKITKPKAPPSHIFSENNKLTDDQKKMLERIKNKLLENKSPVNINKESERDVNKLMSALNIIPKPSKRLETPIIAVRDMKEARELFEDNGDITARDLADMLFTIYDYAIDNKDNETIRRVSLDILTLIRLIKFYASRRK